MPASFEWRPVLCGCYNTTFTGYCFTVWHAAKSTPVVSSQPQQQQQQCLTHFLFRNRRAMPAGAGLWRTRRCCVFFSAAILRRTFGLSPSTLLSTLSHRKWLSFICYYYIRLAKKKHFRLLFLFIGKIDVTPSLPIDLFYWLGNNIFISF